MSAGSGVDDMNQLMLSFEHDLMRIVAFSYLSAIRV